VIPNRDYELIFEKNGYFSKTLAGYADIGIGPLLTANMCLKNFSVNKPILIKNILYDFNKATLRPESEKALDEIVSVLKTNPGIRIELSSHTDSVGSNSYNMNLSQGRAQSCVDYIISKGISAERLTAKGYGKTRPVAPNSLPNGHDNPSGRELNRRTEFTVIEQKQ
jgi:outer membrane protein OmpA-like peptidoglycan-associated protein